MSYIKRFLVMLGGASFMLTLLICYVLAPGAVFAFILYNIATNNGTAMPIAARAQNIAGISIPVVIVLVASLLIARYIIRAKF